MTDLTTIPGLHAGDVDEAQYSRKLGRCAVGAVWRTVAARADPHHRVRAGAALGRSAQQGPNEEVTTGPAATVRSVHGKRSAASAARDTAR
jgi:hypothetical protein